MIEDSSLRQRLLRRPDQPSRDRGRRPSCRACPVLGEEVACFIRSTKLQLSDTVEARQLRRDSSVHAQDALADSRRVGHPREDLLNCYSTKINLKGTQ